MNGSGGEKARTLDRLYLSGIAWTSGGQWLTQVLTWGITIWVARLLSPEDFGIVGMAGVILGLAHVITEGGLGLAVVRFRQLGSREWSQLNSISLGMGTVAFLVFLALSEPIAAFFRTPKLAPVVIVMALGFPLSSLRVIPYGRLQKELDYRSLALLDALKAVTTSISTLILAFLGLGYWSLILGKLIGSTVSVAAFVAKRPTGIGWPRGHSVWEAVLFGFRMVGDRLSWYGYSRADAVIVGRVLGQGPLGAFSYAKELAVMPVDKITALVTRVTGSVFSAVQDSPREFSRYFLRSTEALAMVATPACVGLALVAPYLVRGVLGDQWEPMIIPLQLLSVMATIRSVDPLAPAALAMLGQERFNMRMSFSMLLVLPPLIYLFTRWGINGVAVAWAITLPVFSLIRISRVCRVLNLSLISDYLRCLIPGWVSTGLMAVVVGIAQMFMAGLADFHLLLFSIFVGVISYALALAVLFGDRLRAARVLIKGRAFQR